MKPVIGRAAILLLLIVFVVVVVVLGILATKAHAIKKSDRPDCLPGRAAESCSISFGSTDTSGFVIVKARRKGDTASAGQELVTILFKLPRASEPKCEVRVSDSLPPVTLRVATGGLTLVLREDVRLPSSMRWFYVCR